MGSDRAEEAWEHVKDNQCGPWSREEAINTWEGEKERKRQTGHLKWHKEERERQQVFFCMDTRRAV